MVDGEEHPSLRGELALPPRARVSAHHLLVQVREVLLEPSSLKINLDEALFYSDINKNPFGNILYTY